MNRRVSVWIGSVLGAVACLGFMGRGKAAWGQVPPAVASGQAIPATVKAAGNVAPYQSQITAFVGGQITSLMSPVPAVQGTARQALIAECPVHTATASYYTALGTAFATAASGPLAPTSPLRVRINLGVVTAGLAANGPTTALLPAVNQLLADPNDAVALWGLKAARPLVASLISPPATVAANPLYAAVVNAVKQHAGGGLAGFIAVDAYHALVVDPRGVSGLTEAQVRPRLTPLYDPVLDLLEFRTYQYPKEKGVVPSPDAERDVPVFLSRDYNTGLMTTVQKQRAAQSLIDLLYAAGTQAPTATPTQLTQMRDSLQNAASALNVMSGSGALAPLSRMPPGVTGAQMNALTNAAFGQIQVVLPKGYIRDPKTVPLLMPSPAAAAVPAAASIRPPSAVTGQ